MLKIHAEGKLSPIIMKLLKIKLHREKYHFHFTAAKCQYFKKFKRDSFAVRTGWIAKKKKKVYPLTMSLLYKNINYDKHGNIFMQFYSLFICYINSSFTINI